MLGVTSPLPANKPGLHHDGYATYNCISTQTGGSYAKHFDQVENREAPQTSLRYYRSCSTLVLQGLIDQGGSGFLIGPVRTKMQHLRKSHSLTVFAEPDGWIAYNSLTRDEMDFDAPLLDLLGRFEEWVDEDEALSIVGEFYGTEDAVDSLHHLIDLGCLLKKDSPTEQREAEHLAVWGWSKPSSVLHAAVSGRPVVPIAETLELQKRKVRAEPSPPLTLKHDDKAVTLPEWSASDALVESLGKRRTDRGIEPTSITIETLADSLRAGVGIVEWTTNGVCELPLGYTPSGGARNPYEAYIFVERVTGLDRGYYHYSATQHTLQKVAEAEDEVCRDLLGGQEWADNCACVVLLCAHFERNMWKYEGDDNAYRVVLIEAGHIGQNIMLVAADHNVSACPSAALDHTLIEGRLGMRKTTEAAIYALGLVARP